MTSEQETPGSLLFLTYGTDLSFTELMILISAEAQWTRYLTMLISAPESAKISRGVPVLEVLANEQISQIRSVLCRA